ALHARPGPRCGLRGAGSGRGGRTRPRRDPSLEEWGRGRRVPARGDWGHARAAAPWGRGVVHQAPSAGGWRSVESVTARLAVSRGIKEDACLRCQAENKQEDCVVVWGECNHSFHNCCMSLWVKQNNRCPLCQQDWVVQRIGK
uniref:cullin-RING-type E3 NEDD8 transferase n=1 Tax=Equus asinus TaxID=9793 RepID=A0A9L0IAX6_EQUAS